MSQMNSVNAEKLTEATEEQLTGFWNPDLNHESFWIRSLLSNTCPDFVSVQGFLSFRSPQHSVKENKIQL